MRTVIGPVTEIADDLRLGAFVELQGPAFLDFPAVPTGIAATSEFGAVTYPGAAPSKLPEVVVYEHINFGGQEWRTNLSHRWVGGWWNDRISSIVVVEGRWRFYQHKDYSGKYWDLGVGYYPWVVNTGVPNDVLSSFRNIG